MSRRSTIELPLRIGQRRNLVPVWLANVIVVVVIAEFTVAMRGANIAIVIAPVAIGVCVALFEIIQYRRPATLTLDDTGLAFTWLSRATRWKWSDIDGFRVTRIRNGWVIVFDVYKVRSLFDRRGARFFRDRREKSGRHPARGLGTWRLPERCVKIVTWNE